MNRSRVLRLTLGAAGVLAVAVVSCRHNEVANRDRFARAFLESVRAGSAFHRMLLVERSTSDAEQARDLIPYSPQIIGRDVSAFQPTTYFFQLDSSTTAVLDMGGPTFCLWDVIPWSASSYPCIRWVEFVLRRGELL
jgi:hypothetical protein